MKLNALLSKLREERRLSRLAFAKLIKMAPSAWRYVEVGRSAPQLGTLIACGRETGFDVLLSSGRQSYVLCLDKSGAVHAEPHTTQGQMHLLDKLASELDPEDLPLVCQLIRTVIDTKKEASMPSRRKESAKRKRRP
jgi:transcriptional regulator with XRE-family HTH domain